METKNKINLNPLPQQADDYSRYEDNEFRWDRIIAAILVISLVIVALGYLVFSSDEVINKSELKSKALEISDTSGLKNTPKEVIQTEAPLFLEKAEKVSSSKHTAEILKAIPLENNSKMSVSQQPTKPIKLKREEKIDAKLAVIAKPLVVETVTDVQTRPASVLIVNSAIARANLSLSIKKDEPGRALNHSIVMPEKGIIKVILFTEMNDIRGRTLFHEWYLNGKRQARVRIPVNVSHQKSFSSKFINQQMLGQWLVKVVDENGEPYILADFEVVSS